MTNDRSDREKAEDALRARESLAGEAYSAGELLEGGAGMSEHLYAPVTPLPEGQELQDEAGSDES
ncbi:MAG: hypothetical protein QM598_09810 [Protaetiibacter sp.]